MNITDKERAYLRFASNWGKSRKGNLIKTINKCDICTIFATKSGQFMWSVLPTSDEVQYSGGTFSSVEETKRDLFTHFSTS